MSYRDWALPDPAGQGLEAVRPIRDEIHRRVKDLIAELLPKPKVLFVCMKNGGKSQMAAGLMRQLAGDRVEVHSAGTKPGTAVNALSAQSLLEVGVDISAETPKHVDPQLLRSVDRVVILGSEARLDPVPGPRFENWDTDEPSERGIDGIERMRLVRDDITTRVRALAEQLGAAPTNKVKETVHEQG